MKKSRIHYITILTIMLVSLINFNMAYAGSLIWPGPSQAEITSPFGERGDYGSGSFHYGVDIGYSEGDYVLATADGIIEYYGEASGFGYAAVIYHPSLGISTLYGDIDLIQGVQAGQEVSQGDIIGVISSIEGTTSTGAHLHYEIHTKRYPIFGGSLNGAIDPLPYLEGAEVSPGSESVWENDSNINWSVIADIAKPIRDIIDKLVTASSKAISVLVPFALYLFLTFATISLVLSSINMMLAQEQGLNGIIKSLVAKAIFYSFFVFLITNWSTMLNMVKDYFTQMGAFATAQTIEQAGQLVSDPTAIIQKGANLAVPFFNYVGSFHSKITIMAFLPEIILVFILGFIVLGVFLLIGVQIILAYIEFYVVCVFSIFDVAFAGFKEFRHLKFIGNGINAVFAVSFKLLWYIFFTVIVSMQLSSANFGDMTNMTVVNNKPAVNLEEAGPEAINVFMSAIKMQESTNNYEADNGEGYYGAYQISIDNWNPWVEEAGLAADYDWSYSPHASVMNSAWTPERQDAVARFKMLQYYQQYGNWRSVAEAWHGGGGNVGSGDKYADEVFAKSGQVLPNPTFDFVKALKLTVMAVLIFILGSQISKNIINTFGSPGFRYYF